jgi:hypothetical protein
VSLFLFLIKRGSTGAEFTGLSFVVSDDVMIYPEGASLWFTPLGVPDQICGGRMGGQCVLVDGGGFCTRAENQSGLPTNEGKRRPHTWVLAWDTTLSHAHAYQYICTHSASRV